MSTTRRTSPMAAAPRRARRPPPRSDARRPPGAKAALPATLSPQLATLGDARRPPRRTTGSTRSSSTATACWRASTATRSRCITRNGHDWTSQAAQAGARRSRSWPRARPGSTARSWSPASDGAPDFQALQNAFDSGATASIVYFAVRPALSRRARSARGAAARSAASCWPRCSASKPPDSLRLSEAFEASPRDLLRLGARSWARRHHRQAQGLGLRVAPLAELDQAQEPAAAGVRDRRLHRAQGLAHGLRLAAARRLRRRGRAAVLRQRRHRLRRQPAGATCKAKLDKLAADDRPFDAAPGRRQGALGQAHAGAPRCRSANGRATGASAIRSSRACARDKPAARDHAREPRSARRPRAGRSTAAQRSPPSHGARIAHHPRRPRDRQAERHHQGRPGRATTTQVARADAAAPEGPAGVAGARARRRGRRAVLPEARRS